MFHLCLSVLSQKNTDISVSGCPTPTGDAQLTTCLKTPYLAFHTSSKTCTLKPLSQVGKKDTSDRSSNILLYRTLHTVKRISLKMSKEPPNLYCIFTLGMAL